MEYYWIVQTMFVDIWTWIVIDLDPVRSYSVTR